ncbi:MAG: hypothetical protein ACRD8O_08600 [Bryobacteraceae bacterium]
MKSGLLLKLAGCTFAAAGGLNAGLIFHTGTSLTEAGLQPTSDLFRSLAGGGAVEGADGSYEGLASTPGAGAALLTNMGKTTIGSPPDLSRLDPADIMVADHFIYSEPGRTTLDDPGVPEPSMALFLAGGLLVLGAGAGGPVTDLLSRDRKGAVH